jgi:dTDP-L-rhamnose 4-epimerase
LINPYTGIAALFTRLARARQGIPVYEDGHMLRDFVFIDDVAAAIVNLAGNGVPSADPYDIGSGQATSILELATVIANLYGAPAPQVTGAYRNGDMRHASCDISRTRTDLGWTPEASLEGGLRALCRWIDTMAAHD